MHFAIRQMEEEAVGPALRKLPQLPEMQPIHEPKHEGALSGHVIEDWRPEDETFWKEKGAAIAKRNLWISIPNLLLAFAVWMVWSVVVAKLPQIGFKFTTGELFWLASLPGLSGATLRIFYSFMVPIFGGRLWTTLSTWSLIIPALGIGFAVQNPNTPYLVFVLLALLCGFGGGNFASSMANISFFFPKREKGNALALNFFRRFLIGLDLGIPSIAQFNQSGFFRLDQRNQSGLFGNHGLAESGRIFAGRLAGLLDIDPCFLGGHCRLVALGAAVLIGDGDNGFRLAGQFNQFGFGLG